MTIPPEGSTIHLTLAATAVRESASAPSQLENEIILLFDQLRDRLLRYVLSFGLPSADGEEIIQEAFLSLFQHLRQGRPRHNLRGWLFRVAHNQALKKRSSNDKRLDVAYGDGMPQESHPDPTPNPEEQVHFSQRQSRLLAVLQALPANDQRCLRLRAEGLTYREIADVLGVSLGSISVSLTRSLARLGRVDGR